ncbi:Ig-like domain-containing protein [Roseibium sp. HPY-6]|uniref:Ig-like domain-containing protein n=1 Tax=Roseibium sp. HPY-6 TaxID=3229852 RepID=UPI00338DF091
MANIIGTPGDDQFGLQLIGTAADDNYFGFAGNDWLIPSLGDDVLDGGADLDVAIYDASPLVNGVFINNTSVAISGIAAFTVDKGLGGTDTLIDIENFHGTNFDDTIYVGGLGLFFTYTFDRAGNDYVEASQDPNATSGHTFFAGSGNDTYVGTIQFDRVDYQDDGSADAAGPVFQGVNVDLAAGTATDGWGGTDTLIGIEDVSGTDLADIIFGDANTNNIFGNGGNDQINGGAGGADYLNGGTGNDTIIADPDGSFMVGGEGDDTLIGGSGFDTIAYNEDAGNGGTNGIVADLVSGIVVDGFGDTDTVSGIERIIGTEFNDQMTGDSNPTRFRGLAGDDFIDGGSSSRDRVDYDRDPSGVTVNLLTGTATDGWGDTDTLVNIERIRGSNFDDNLTGDANRNQIRPLEGNDFIDGGDGRDTVDYSDETFNGGLQGVNVDLAAGTATDAFGTTDTLINIEEVVGTSLDDVLLGDSGDNYLEGREGDDELRGFGGFDELSGGQGNDILDGGSNPFDFSGGDRASYSQEHENGGSSGIVADLNTGIVTDTFGDTDTLIDIEEIQGSVFDDIITGSAGDEQLRGEDGNDTLTGNDGNDDLSGGAGNDSLDGGDGGDFLQPGAGTDTVIGGANGPLGEDDELSYIFDSRDVGTSNGIAVTFTNATDGTVIDYAGDTDTFTGIERVRGTNNADTFIGSIGDQTFQGFGGADHFDGGAGDRDRIDYNRERADLDSPEFGIVVNMVAGTATDTYGDTDTFTGIEEIRGSRFDDFITGDNNRNNIQGGDGVDTLDSFGGSDNYIEGGAGNDIIHARGDDDSVNGGQGNDVITFYGNSGFVDPGLGSDTITGGTTGFFLIAYQNVSERVVVDTALGTTQLAGGDVDTFTNIRNAQGGEANDDLLGDDLDEYQEFQTSLGDDFIDGRGGDDDWLIYDYNYRIDNPNAADVQVTIDFINGTATGVLAGNDTFQNIEGARGTFGNDVFIGSNQAFEEFQGLAGNDTFTGNGGLDRLNYSFDDNRGGLSGVVVNLSTGTATDGFGDTDTFTGIEQVNATDFSDTLTGDGNENILIGRAGMDTISGGAGDDGIYAGGDIDTVTGGTGSDIFGGRIWELDGDIITDLSFEDKIRVFDEDFNDIGANLTIVGSELRIDIDGDGAADATMQLTNGYSGPVESFGGPVGGPVPTFLTVENAGLFGNVISEDNTSVTIEVTRSGDVFTTASVDVTITGTGLNPANASDISSPFSTIETVTFLPGEMVKSVVVDISEDGAIEPNEDLAVTLSNAVSDGTLPAQINGGETYIRILNDDFPETVSIEGGRAPEDSGVLTFTVERTGDTSSAIDVPYTIRSAGGTQGAESDDLVNGLDQSGVVTIAAGQTTATFTIGIVPDSINELHDDVIASISTDPSWPANLAIGTREAIGSIRNDDGVPPNPPLGATASNWGDPHIVTLDGLGYDFQAVGEFTLIEATSGDPLNVQVRYKPVLGSDIASQTSAVATTLGTARVVIDIDAASLVTVNGVAFDLATAAGGASLGDGQIFFDGEIITLVYANGEQLHVTEPGDFLNTNVYLNSGRDVRGLLGDGDGDPSNDLALKDGTTLSQPVDFDVLYGAFAADWRITDSTSLFNYPAGQGTDDFTDLSFPSGVLSIDDLPDEILQPLLDATADISDPVAREAAILDALLTGDIETVLQSVEDVNEADDSTEPDNAPVVESAVGVIGSSSQLIEGNTGVQSLVYTIYRTGDLSEALSLDYSFSGTADSTDFSGIGGGTLNFGIGETAKLVEVGLLGDTDVEGNEDLVFEMSVTSGSPSLINSTFKTTVLDDDAAPNAQPVAEDDDYKVDEDVTLSVPIDGVLDNDTDADGDTLTVTVTSDVSHGSLDLKDDGSFDYTPDANFNGVDSFTYEVSDGKGGVDEATVTITVDPVNDDPVAGDDSGFTTDFETPIEINATDLLDNDDDGDPDETQPLSITNVGNPLGGTVSLAAGIITFTPAEGFSGEAQFTYELSDGAGGTDTAVVLLEVGEASNDAPIAVDDTTETDEDNAVTFNILDNDTDPDGDQVQLNQVFAEDGTLIPFDVETALASGGTITISRDGTTVFDPAGDFEALGFNPQPEPPAAAFDLVYNIIEDTDEGLVSDNATVTISVRGQNDAPLADDFEVETTEDMSVILPILDMVSDVDGDDLELEFLIDPAIGEITFDGEDYRFTPAPDVNGDFDIEYIVTDEHESSSRGILSLTIEPENDDPVAVDDSATTDQDTFVAIDYLANDTDPDGDGLTVTSVGPASNGVASLTGYTPDPGFFGTDSFTYTISDGNGGTATATATVTVVSESSEVADYSQNSGGVYTRLDRGWSTDIENKALGWIPLTQGIAASTVPHDDLVNVQDIVGSDFLDLIVGDAANNLIRAGDGNDYFSGLAGDDSLFGEEGNDRIFGGLGNDTLDGGEGNDQLTGGEGLDIFIFNGGHDVIRDFDPQIGEDENGADGDLVSISISGISDFDDLLATASQDGADTVFNISDDDRLTLQDTLLVSLEVDDFKFV